MGKYDWNEDFKNAYDGDWDGPVAPDEWFTPADAIWVAIITGMAIVFLIFPPDWDKILKICFY